jgi:hypothetical protein
MRFGRANVVAGALGLLVGSLGGLALGATFDRFAVRDGLHALTLARFYLREGHSHTMPISLLNLIVGVLLDRLSLSDGLKRACSWLTVLAFVLPLGLAAKGAAGAPSDFPPVGIIGALAFVGAVLLLIAGSRRAN